MIDKVTVWTLNRATDLLHEQMDDIARIFKKDADIECKPGVRKESEPNYHLMYEGDDYNEYFVPIALKCIGNKFMRPDDLDDEGRELLNGIIQQFHYFHSNNHEDFWRFWNHEKDMKLDPVISGPYGKVRMMTENGMGYYEILEQFPNNILIAYSQGGLVARFLAFLDEYVFKKNVITAIITIASPNYGSPLANPSNENSIVTGFQEIFFSMLSLYSNEFPRLYNYTTPDFSEVYRGIIEAYHDAKDQDHEIQELLKTAIKWLSGIKNNPNSAFDDLDIANFRYKHSVLNLIEKYPLKRIHYGAVLTVNNNLNDLIYSTLSWIGDIIFSLINRYFGKRMLWNHSLTENFQKASQIYNETVMKENLQGGNVAQIESEIANRFQTEYVIPKCKNRKIKVSKIKKYAHDFIIPSAYQVLPDGDKLLGHYINEFANHNSGKSVASKPGKKNLKYIKNLLKELKERLRT